MLKSYYFFFFFRKPILQPYTTVIQVTDPAEKVSGIAKHFRNVRYTKLNALLYTNRRVWHCRVILTYSKYRLICEQLRTCESRSLNSIRIRFFTNLRTRFDRVRNSYESNLFDNSQIRSELQTEDHRSATKKNRTRRYCSQSGARK